MKIKRKIAVIGSGPAGLMAAITAAQKGNHVTVFEALPEPGRKLLATGGGRCNITNVAEENDFLKSFGKNGRFMLPALSCMNNKSLRAFFSKIGVPTVEENNFYVFPREGGAKKVLQKLLQTASAAGVEIRCKNPVKSLTVNYDKLGLFAGESEHTYDAIIAATGGCGYSPLGTGSAFWQIAEELGHRIVTPLPALTGLRAAGASCRSLAGLSLQDIEITIHLKKYKNVTSRGDLLFTHTGISGPAVLNLSGTIAQILRTQAQKSTEVMVPLRIKFNDCNEQQWQERLDNWRKTDGKKQLLSLLKKYCPASLTAYLAKSAGIDAQLKCSEITKQQRDIISSSMGGLPVNIIATDGFEKAMVTRGGINLKDVDPKTLMSKRVKNLFFAGETLDLDGPCGGYNLQWAFSSGYLCGLSASVISTE